MATCPRVGTWASGAGGLQEREQSMASTLWTSACDVNRKRRGRRPRSPHDSHASLVLRWTGHGGMRGQAYPHEAVHSPPAAPPRAPWRRQAPSAQSAHSAGMSRDPDPCSCLPCSNEEAVSSRAKRTLRAVHATFASCRFDMPPRPAARKGRGVSAPLSDRCMDRPTSDPRSWDRNTPGLGGYGRVSMRV